MVLSDSFGTTIFKEAFFRMFDKDENGFLTMGFNATFDVQVLHAAFLFISQILTDNLDYKRTKSLGFDWTCYFCW